MKIDHVVVKNYPKTDLRTQRKLSRDAVAFSHTLEDIAHASGISKRQVITEKSRGYFDPDDLRSVAVYIARRILFRDFK